MKYIITLFAIVLTCCKSENLSIFPASNENFLKVTDKSRLKETLQDSIYSNDQEFINRVLLKGKYEVDLSLYAQTDCSPMFLPRKYLIEEFEGFQNIGDIDNDQNDDFVYVLQPINYCEQLEGESYYFSNSKIPRISTDSYCCHPKSIFSIGDIDEDGSNEIAQYYSSCASRYKSIRIWTLKNNEWQQLAKFAFTLNDEYAIFEDFDNLFQKVAKGKLRFLEISDVNAQGELISEWKTIKM